MLIHGWPGSFVEFIDLIGPLTDPAAHGGDPADAFHVVIPSVPGFGFSTPLSEAGWTHGRIAKAFTELMARLGYDRYGVQGGDIGAFEAPLMGQLDPEHVIGVHVNALVTFPSGDPAELEGLTEAEQERLARFQNFEQDMSGYMSIQGTRPQTLAYGLADSPAGQLAWIVEKFKEWTDPAAELAGGCGRPRPHADQRQHLLVHQHRWVVRQPLLRDVPRPEPVRAQRARHRADRRGRLDSPRISPSGVWPSATTTSCAGRNSTKAAISRRWRTRSSWSRTCERFSVGSVEARHATRQETAFSATRMRTGFARKKLYDGSHGTCHKEQRYDDVEPVAMTEVHPFHVEISQADLDDLHNRLAQTRWPDQLPGPAGAAACRSTTSKVLPSIGAPGSTGGSKRHGSTPSRSSRPRSTVKRSISSTSARQSPTPCR